MNFTTSTLRKCKQLVLRPYWGLLTFVGWRGFGKESIHSHSCHRWRAVNVIYPVFVLLCLLFTYSYEVIACSVWIHPSKISKGSVKCLLKTTEQLNTTTQTDQDLHNDNKSRPTDYYVYGHDFGCEHIITNFIVPNILHFLAYSLGFYYFRIQENEQLYALMEKVFLQATLVHARSASQQNMIRRLKIFLFAGSGWVFLTVALNFIYTWSFQLQGITNKISLTTYWLLLSFRLLGSIVFNCVILAIMLNYTTQCEMIKFYVKGLVMRLQEKSTDLRIAMKDLLMLRHSLGLLNGHISKMTSLASIVLAELTIIGLCQGFLNNKGEQGWTQIYYIVFSIIWMAMLAFPLFEVARVNSVCLRIQKIAIEMRVFGYKGATIIDLDSFLSLVTTTRLKGKLFHITIRPAHLIFTILLTLFILIILFQTDVITPSQNLFPSN